MSTVLIHRSADELAAAAAARLITRLVDLQAAGHTPAVALTGGGVGTATLAAVAASPARGAVRWSEVDLFWGDERFLPEGDGERNETQARSALLDHLDLDPAHVHPIAPSDGEFGDDPDAAAAAYAALLDGRNRPLDIVMLGMGGEGHVASVFPHSPALDAPGSAVAVRNCPKPPPTRVSMTLAEISSADEVWLLVAGASKAKAVAAALDGATARDIPAAGAVGRNATLWFVDREAASRIRGGAGQASSGA